MWIEIDLSVGSVRSTGFHVHTAEGKQFLYFGDPEGVQETIQSVLDSDFCIGVEIPDSLVPVRFTRDYLGKIPLLYAALPGRLFVSDELNEVFSWLVEHGVLPPVSETAVAMYFVAGYVPQGMCLYDGIQVCRNATIYEWDGQSVLPKRVFSPISPDSTIEIDAVGRAVETEVTSLASRYPMLDTWCSGGIDSSTIAMLHNTKGRTSELLTLSYGQSLIDDYGEGEIPHARTMAQACDMPLRTVEMDEDLFKDVHASFVRGHHSPAIDTCLLAKYALATATRAVAVTGEGGDPVFGGVKNDFISYYHHRHPDTPIGHIYSLSHKRFGPALAEILVRGRDLSQYADDYFQSIVSMYPGDLTRQLFYLNTFEKQGGMIFPESYYPAKRSAIRVFHPLTSRRVYEAAFTLTDEKRYVYPNGKLVLTGLYRDKLPQSIVNREKSGTQIPLRAYLASLPSSVWRFESLRSTKFFRDDFLDSSLDGRLTIDKAPLLLYALVTLDLFLATKRKNTLCPEFIHSKQ
jgi:asparagine synthetase B (glutamine-hydrolysing)